jgi:hypothetical protein
MTKDLELLSLADAQTIVENINKDTIFKFKIYKNAYNIPGR